MSEYIPDKWVVIDYGDSYTDERYAILAGWRGNFVTPDSWKRSSPIVKWEEVQDDKIVATTFSGSEYILWKNNIGVTMLTARLAAQASLTIIDEWGKVLEITKGEENV